VSRAEVLNTGGNGTTSSAITKLISEIKQFIQTRADLFKTEVTRDIPDPLTGDLDGTEIHIDYAVTSEQRLFLLAHLFGHTVQWNTDSASFEIGRQYQPPVDEALFPSILAYEGEAAAYGLSMLHELGITTIDQWVLELHGLRSGILLALLSHRRKADFFQVLER